METNAEQSSHLFHVVAQVCQVTDDTVVDIARKVFPSWKKIAGPVIEQVKTIDFVETVAVLTAISRTGLGTFRLLELGTQHGISTCIFLDGLRAIGIQPRITTYDVVLKQRAFSGGEVDARIEDITTRCGPVLDELDPHAVFLDAHPWELTYNMATEARKRQKLIFTHDVSDDLWSARLQEGRLPLKGNECNPFVQWERKVLEVVFGPGIHTGHHVTEDYQIDLIRSTHGVAICQPLRGTQWTTKNAGSRG
ncbi:MAG: hypothetical protein HY360_25380 [Verrucomicrobia bacterium]|nr:hypothetical protein [Verrucomicrobiota bacterium]